MRISDFGLVGFLDSLTVDVESRLVVDRPHGVGGAAAVQAAILDAH